MFTLRCCKRCAEVALVDIASHQPSLPRTLLGAWLRFLNRCSREASLPNSRTIRIIKAQIPKQ